MNLLSVGASYRTADVSTLERLTIAEDAVPALLQKLVSQPYVGEAVVLSTCNRVEIYAAVSGFHGGLGDVCNVLAEVSGIPATELAGHLYVHYDEAAVQHSFRVSAGLDSMVVGEAQILGQLRDAYHAATDADTAGRLLHELMQQALRVGKRAHAETGIDRAGQTVVTAALEVASSKLGDLTGRPALVIGAGAMGALSVATLTRAGVGPVRITNRSAARADRLAEAYGAVAVPFEDLDAALRDADLVISATAASEPVLTRDRLETAGPLVVLDLAVPRDVAPDAVGLANVMVIDIDSLAASRRALPAAAETAAVEQIVTAEVEHFLGWLRGADIAPTVAALRNRAEDVVAGELRKLYSRRSEFTEEQRGDVSRTLHRVVQQLLHSPTVRVRQLAAEPGGDQYAALLRELFDLDVPHATQADAVPEIGGRARDAPLRLGTRGSALALAQSQLTADALTAATGRPVELVRIVTAGDRSAAPVAQLGVGVFVSALRDALLSGEIDFAVHSYKDLPTGEHAGLHIAAVPPREDPRDVLIAKSDLTLAELPPGSMIGTGAVRRIAQLRALGLELQVTPIRGNVDSRIARVRGPEADLDAVVVARAGVARLGRAAEITETIDPMLMLPAPAQGALAVECRADNADLVELLAALDHAPSRAAVVAERAMLATLEAGCSAPVAAHAEHAEGEHGDEIYLRGAVISPDGSRAIRLSRTGTPADAAEIGKALAADLLDAGADTLMGSTE